MCEESNPLETLLIGFGGCFDAQRGYASAVEETLSYEIDVPFEAHKIEPPSRMVETTKGTFECFPTLGSFFGYVPSFAFAQRNHGHVCFERSLGTALDVYPPYINK